VDAPGAWWYYRQYPVARLLDEAKLQGKMDAWQEATARFLTSTQAQGWTRERVNWEIREMRRLHGIREMTTIQRARRSWAQQARRRQP